MLMTEVVEKVLLEHEMRDIKCSCGAYALTRKEFAHHQAVEIVKELNS